MPVTHYHPQQSTQRDQTSHRLDLKTHGPWFVLIETPVTIYTDLPTIALQGSETNLLGHSASWRAQYRCEEVEGGSLLIKA